MAVYGTQLYNKPKEKIYPISDATVVTCGLSAANSSTYEDVKYLFERVAELTGEGEAVSGIEINIAYKRSKSKVQADIEPADGWGETFLNPSSALPYTWKRTIIKYKEAVTNTTYEIVASANNEITQTIYIAVSDNTQPTISYIDPNTGKENLHLYDLTLPEFWSEQPASLSAATPNVFISTRKRIDGEWGKFSNPVQYGRWAFDSAITVRYQVTKSTGIPPVARNLENPGVEWVKENTSAFTGYLWMITATEVSGQLQTYNEVIWSNPSLISVVK